MQENKLMKEPVEILKDLGMFEKTAQVRKLNERAIEEFRQRKRAFDWVHMGTSDLPVGKLIEILRNNPFLSVPRTGHFGNWQDIAKGRAGMLDYNGIICGKRKLGYPLVYDFNQTEDANLQNGDWIYLPGSIVEKGERKELRLFTWDGTQFIERSREYPLLTPFVLTSMDGELVPLSQVHWKRMQQLSGFEFSLQSSVILAQEQLVKEIFHELIEEARTQPEPQLALENILARAVALDGRVYPQAIKLDGQGYRLGEAYYENTAAMIDAMMLPFLAVTKPDLFFTEIGNLPKLIPQASAIMFEMLCAVLNTHYPSCKIDREKMTQPCNLHFHWGAIAMAGYPPKKKGYISQRIANRKKIYQSVIERFSQLDPVFYIMLPASIFTLFPNESYPRDITIVEDLIDKVHKSTDSLLGNPSLIAEKIDQIVKEWSSEVHESLSSYFVNRFLNRRSVFNKGDLPEHSELIEPRGFDTLTIRQASMLVGALIEAFQ